MLSQPQMEELLREAELAARHSYSPYSKFPVGAALLTAGGDVFRGANVENASYGLAICAERSAVVTAVSAGCTDFAAVAVHADRAEVTPCGACRQFLCEFGPGIVVVVRRNGQAVGVRAGDLLPGAFSAAALQ